MAYDERLADRIRELLAPERAVTEKKMFGGIAFLIGGRLAVAASGQGGILVRVDRAESDGLVTKTKATVAIMRGRPMQGWLRVEAAGLRTRAQLSTWVARGQEAALAQPVKRKRS